MPIKFRRPGGTTPPAASSDPSFLERMGGLRGLAGTGVRIGSGILASPGMAWGGAVGGAGELASELVEGTSPNKARIATEAAIGAVPMSSIFKVGKPVASAIRSGAMSATGTIGRELAMGEDVSPRAALESGGMGALMGLLLGKMGPSTKAKPRPVMNEVVPTAQMGGQTLSPSGKGTQPVRPIARIAEKGGAEVPYGAEPAGSPRVQMFGPGEGPIYRSGTKQSLASDATEFLEDTVKPAEAQAKLNTKEAKNQAKLNLVDRLLAGKKQGTVTGGESIAAETPEGLTRRAAIRFKNSKSGGAKSAPKKITREGQMVGLDVFDTGGKMAKPANLIRGRAFDPETAIQGGVRIDPASVEEGLSGFSPSGVPPTGLARFFGVKEPLGAPKEPSAKALAQAESERMLRQKMQEESIPRPTEWDQYPPEVAQELDRLGLAYRSAPEGLEKRGLGAQLSELKMFMSGKRKTGESYMRDSWKGATPPAGATSSTTPPPVEPEAPDWVSEQLGLVDKLKDLYGKQKGEIGTGLMTRLGLGLGGAAIGAAADPLDNRYASGAAGFAGGAMLPSVPGAISGLDDLMKNIGETPEGIQVIKERAAQEGPKVTAQRLLETFPQYQRFNMLASLPGLAANAVAGPWGSAMVGAIEAGLSGDPRGWSLAKSLLSREAINRTPAAWDEAIRLIREGDVGRAETIFGENLAAKTMMGPGTAMTTGDVVARSLIQDAGFPEDVARSMTMTNEPEFQAFRKIAEFTKGSPVLQTMMPFTRTLANIGEQGAIRAPILGTFVQALRDAPDSMKTQLIQQGMSVGIGGANYFLGQTLDPDTAKLVRRFSTNLAGRYGLAANVGFAAGQASQKGQDLISTAGVRAVQEGFPLPTTDIPESYVREFSNLINGRDVSTPRGLIPTFFTEELSTPPTTPPSPRRIRFRRP